jgi:hypothetical protein
VEIQSLADDKEVGIGPNKPFLYRTATLAALSTLPLILAACLMVPPVKVSSDEVIPFEDSQLGNLQAGVTSKADVLEVLGAPGIEFDSGSVWVYEDVYHEDWFFLAVAVAPAIGGYGGSGTAEGGRYEKDIPYFLIIRFDLDGSLTSHKIVPLGDNYFAANLRCNEEICASWLATRDEEGTLYWNKDYPVESWLDGQPAGWLLNKKQFFFWQLDPGTHHLFARATLPLSRQILDSTEFEKHSIHLNCEAGHLYFLELRVMVERRGFFKNVIDFGMELQQRDAAKGRKAIGKRQLVLSTWDASRKARPVILTPDMELRVIDAGVTTREDIIARFGPPDIESEKHGLMVNITDGAAWFELIEVENGMQMLGQQYLLFTRFDSEGIATEYELHSINSILNSSIAYVESKETAKDYEHVSMNIHCTADGYCVAAGGFLARYATSGENKKAKRARASKEECLINIFSDERNAIWRISLDGEFAAYIDDAAWPGGFLQWRLPVGDYSITTEVVDGAGDRTPERADSVILPPSQTEQITCRWAQEYYLRLDVYRDRLSWTWRDDSLYKKKISKRNLILNEF